MLKNDKFIWFEESKEAFQKLKEAIVHPHTLALLDFSIPFTIECDASGEAIGAVLMQKGSPLAFFSHALKGRARGMSAYKREYFALVLAVQKWKPYLFYLLGRHFLVKTNQQNLKYLLDQKVGLESGHPDIAKVDNQIVEI